MFMGSMDNEPLIISASRTKDMVHRSPDLLAEVLSGKAPCRWGPHGPLGEVDPKQVHTVVLWTKNPHNLLHHENLRETLKELHRKYHIQVSLQVTATGLGGSFVEPEIPHWQAVYADLKQILSEGWINPKAVVYRYDPFLAFRTPAGNVISNISSHLFAQLCTEFTALGIPRVTTSRADSDHYPRAAQRVQSLGLEWLQISDIRAETFCREMAECCRARSIAFSICCNPAILSQMRNWGCIDSRLLNRLKDDFTPATEKLHNEIGKQRPTCQCTYSRDIGYSPGSATCYSGGFGCLYCYSQGNARLPDFEGVKNEIEAFDADPAKYLKSKDLPSELLGS